MTDERTAQRGSLLTGVGLAVALCLALALFAPDERDRAPLLAAALLAATTWLALQARDRTGRRSWAVTVAAVGIAGLFTVPALLMVAAPSLTADLARPLSGGLLVHLLLLLGVIGGLVLGRLLPFRALARLAPRLDAAPPGGQARRSWRLLAGWAVSLVALAAFLHAAGGVHRYYTQLDKTGASTAGLTYLIWGVLAAKFFTVAELMHRWSEGRRAGLWLAVATAASILLAGAIGARILVVSALGQLVLAALVVRGPSRRSVVAVGLASVAAAACFVGLGELRRWQSLGSPGPFPAYLVQHGLPDLPHTYVNQYADGVRVAILAKAAVPTLAPHEHGLELLRVAAQPIPGGLRPEIPRSAALRQIFTTDGGTSGNALPLAVDGYLQFGAAGAALAGILLGLVLALVERGLARPRRVGTLLALVALTTGSVMVLRGSLPQATAFALMDVIGFLAADRFLTGSFARRAARAPADEPRGRAVVPPGRTPLPAD
jgi:hypothetical protein